MVHSLQSAQAVPCIIDYLILRHGQEAKCLKQNIHKYTEHLTRTSKVFVVHSWCYSTMAFGTYCDLLKFVSVQRKSCVIAHG